MTKFKLAIFDLAGTTVRDNNTVGGCLQKTLHKAGVNASVGEVNAVMGMPKPIAIRALLERSGVEGDVNAIHEGFRELMIETYRTGTEVGEVPGTSDTFSRLKTMGYRLAVDTGFDRETTDVLLDRLRWNGLIDDSVTSDEVENGRPHPDMILELCRRAGCSPAETIKVGDTPSDIEEGRAAGVGLNVGVLYGTHSENELMRLRPDALLGDIRDLFLLEI